MASIVFNKALGMEAYYGSLPAANDALGVLLLAASGLPSDATLRDCATVAAVVAAGTEQTTMGRKTLASVTVTVDNTADRVAIDCADIVWTASAGAAVGAMVIFYDPDTTAPSDSSRIPIAKLDFSITPDGSDVTAGIPDFLRITSSA